MDNSIAESKFEKAAAKAYKRFAQAAEEYHFTFRRSAVTCGVKPCMVFLGNHSSGKSSIINWILGENVQDTGLAPTDDGFTFIVYGPVKPPPAGFVMCIRSGRPQRTPLPAATCSCRGFA